jgi:MYXO-CTERM domain-containing protein
LNWRALIELPLAFVLKRLMAPPSPRRTRPAPRPDPEPAVAEAPTAPPKRGPLALLALVALIVGCGLLIPFDAWLARLLGVLALFAFIVTGVFAIATPALLGQEGKDR